MKKKRFYIASVTFVATLRGLLFGYDTAVISVAENSINKNNKGCSNEDYNS